GNTTGTFLLDNTLPTVAMSAPTQSPPALQDAYNANSVSGISTGGSGQMHGTATDPSASGVTPSGVALVRGTLTVLDTSGTTQYWDGSAFQPGTPAAGTYQILTSLAPTGGLGVAATSWTITNAPT